MQDAYTAARRDWYAARGRQIGPLQVPPETWQRMAKFMLEQRIANYLAFIQLQFEQLGSGALCPPPKQCYGPAALRRWRDDERQGPQALATATCGFEFQQRHAQQQLQEATAFAATAGWTDEERDRYVLLNEDNQLSALFRYSMAVRSRRPEVAQQFEAAAVLEYLFGRELYDRVWGEFIPAELRDFAAQFLLGVDEEQAWPSA